MAASIDVDLTLDPADLARVRAMGDRFRSGLPDGVAHQLEAEATATVQSIRQRVLSAPASVDVGLRQGIAAGVETDVASGPGEAQLTIRATGSALPGSKQALVVAFNQPSFRHPVYGGPGSASQSGRPYFGEVIEPREHQFERAVQLGVDDALDEIGGSA